MTPNRTLRACLVAGVFSAGAAVAVGPSLATAASEAFKDVVVRNSDSQPVPTKATGTTKVDASGHTLTINGTADVTGSRVDASGSTITVQGDPSGAPVPVEVTNQAGAAPATEPLSRIHHIWPYDTVGTKFTAINFDVPADENWTIDHVAVHQPDYRDGTAAPVESVILDALWSEPRGFTAIAGTNHSAFSQDVKMYASAGSQFHLAAAWRNDSDSKGLVIVTLTGEKSEAPPAAQAAAEENQQNSISSAEWLRRSSGKK